MEFDFSDHVVLCIVQYIVPSMLEMYYLLQRTSDSHNSNNHSSSNVSQQELSKSVWYVMPLVVCVVMIAMNIRLILLTTMYFHTPLENMVGFAIAMGFGFLPLYSKRFTAMFLNLIAMDLK